MKQTGRVHGCIRHLAGWIRRPHINIVVIVLLMAATLPLVGIPGTVGIGLLIQTVDLTLRLRESCVERPASTATAVSS
jgi:hypothetical protein